MAAFVGDQSEGLGCASVYAQYEIHIFPPICDRKGILKVGHSRRLAHRSPELVRVCGTIPPTSWGLQRPDTPILEILGCFEKALLR
jgi:hypothetical protein